MVEEASTSHITPMMLIQWNCRGAANHDFKVTFQDLGDTHRASIFILTETKLCGDRALDVINQLGLPNFTLTDSEGLFGGIFVLWTFEISFHLISHTVQEIHAHIKVISYSFYRSAIYSKPAFTSKLNFWNI